MDSEYLKENMGDCLVEALTEVALRRPDDPIAFLASYIRYYDTKEKQQHEKAREEAMHQENLRDDEEKVEEETEEHTESEAPTETTVEAAEDKMSGEEEKPSTADPENQESLDEHQSKEDQETTVEHFEVKPQEEPNPDPTEVMEADQDEEKVAEAAEPAERFGETIGFFVDRCRQQGKDQKAYQTFDALKRLRPSQEAWRYISKASQEALQKEVDEEETVEPEDSTEPEAAAPDDLNLEQMFPHQETEEDILETEQPRSPVLQNQEQEADGQATSELTVSSTPAETDLSPE